MSLFPLPVCFFRTATHKNTCPQNDRVHIFCKMLTQVSVALLSSCSYILIFLFPMYLDVILSCALLFRVNGAPRSDNNLVQKCMFFITEDIARVNVSYSGSKVRNCFIFFAFSALPLLFDLQQGTRKRNFGRKSWYSCATGIGKLTRLSVLKTQVSPLLDWTERKKILVVTTQVSAACQTCTWVSKKLQLAVEVHGSISIPGQEKESFSEKQFSVSIQRKSVVIQGRQREEILQGTSDFYMLRIMMQSTRLCQWLFLFACAYINVPVEHMPCSNACHKSTVLGSISAKQASQSSRVYSQQGQFYGAHGRFQSSYFKLLLFLSPIQIFS